MLMTSQNHASATVVTKILFTGVMKELDKCKELGVEVRLRAYVEHIIRDDKAAWSVSKSEKAIASRRKTPAR